jgi:hypothetical protein
MEDKKQISGIGGWLILPMLGLFFAPLKLGFLLLSTFVPIFTNGAWENLTTKGTQAYHPLWAPLLIIEIIGNSAFIVFAILLLILLFRKNYLFPKLMITFLAANLIFVVLDFFIADLIPAVAKESNSESVRELLRTILAAVIWIPYFIRSVRVKNTFCRRGTLQNDLVNVAVEPSQTS